MARDQRYFLKPKSLIERRYSYARLENSPYPFSRVFSPDMGARICSFGYQTGHKLIPSNVLVR